MQELNQALTQIAWNTAPGHGKIIYNLLQNLIGEQLEALLSYYNTHWQQGTSPQQWHHVDVFLVPKSHKPIAIDNLRPISLTSCAGKLCEHLVTQGLTDLLEETDALLTPCSPFAPTSALMIFTSRLKSNS